jgi:sensor domain CHASE-containing protein
MTQNSKLTGLDYLALGAFGLGISFIAAVCVKAALQRNSQEDVRAQVRAVKEAAAALPTNTMGLVSGMVS